jgi:hypothetical protein
MATTRVHLHLIAVSLLRDDALGFALLRLLRFFEYVWLLAVNSTLSLSLSLSLSRNENCASYERSSVRSLKLFP